MLFTYKLNKNGIFWLEMKYHSNLVKKRARISPHIATPQPISTKPVQIVQNTVNTSSVRRSDFHYDLPEELIAQRPLDRREDSRLLVLYRSTGEVLHKSFTDFVSFIEEGDLLILNNSKVIPARLRGRREGSGGKMELLLVEEVEPNVWWCMVKPGKRLRQESRFELNAVGGTATGIIGELLAKNSEGHGKVRFSGAAEILNELEQIGETPLPPYIERPKKPDANDLQRYQTVYADPAGSVAAPTAGLHFSEAIMESVQEKGARTAFVTLHVGLGTFAPVKADNVEDHQMHSEQFELSAETARLINETKASGGKVIAIGTTSVRVLETVAAENDAGMLPEIDHRGKTDIFIHPPRNFRIVDRLLTNFHLPESTLMMLISAFAAPGSLEGRESILNAYRTAVENRYRFFSYGDAMLIR